MPWSCYNEFRLLENSILLLNSILLVNFMQFVNFFLHFRTTEVKEGSGLRGLDSSTGLDDIAEGNARVLFSKKKHYLT